MTIFRTYPVVKFKKLSPTAQIPKYQTPGAAGMDLHAIEDGWLRVGRRHPIPTGLAVELPEGYEAQVRSRSGLALKHGVVVLNSPGTIDSDYRGEIGVILINTSNVDFKVNAGDRIAQLVIAPVSAAQVVEVTETTATERGAGGFGSTGVKS